MMKKRALVIVTCLCYVIAQAGASRAVCPTQPIEVVEGEDAVLQCRLDPPVNLSAYTVDFRRVDNQQLVHVYRNRRDDADPQVDQYRGRTSLNHQDLTRGVLTLTISSASRSDNVSFKCFVPKLDAGCVLHVIVGTKTNVSSTTGPAEEEVKESADRGRANREADRAAVVPFAVLLLLCVLGALLVKYIRERLARRRRRRLEEQNGAYTDKNQDGADGDQDQETGVLDLDGAPEDGLLNVCEVK